MKSSFYTIEELTSIGFRSFGTNVKISRFSSIYSPELISVGDNVRIDDFCILSGNINLKNNIHISAYCALYGLAGIVLEDYSGLSPRCTLFSTSDDFSGEYLIGPHNLEEYTNVKTGQIKLNKYSQLGAGTIVLPSVEIGEGSVTGAMTLLNRSIGEWGIYIDIPAKRLKNRSENLLKYIPKI